MKGIEVLDYTSRFDDLAILNLSFVTPENKKFNRYIRGLTL